MYRRSSPRREAFTLLEVLLVLVILVVIGGIVTVNFMGIQKGAQEDAARTQLNGVKDAIKMYQLHVGTLPTTLEGLTEKPNDIADPARWRGPYFEQDIPVDPWGNGYKFTPSGTGFELRSAGADGQEGSEDDVVVTSGKV